MEFFRAIPWDPKADTLSAALLVPPRRLQGTGRHDNVDQYITIYCSMDSTACVSEVIQNFNPLTDANLIRSGKRLHLFKFTHIREIKLLDADDPKTLSEISTRPSIFATRERLKTQPIARQIFTDGNDGLLWWSTIESSWINASLFAERVTKTLKLIGTPIPLTINSEEIRLARARE